MQHPHAHHGEEVVRGVGVRVDAPVESGCCVAPDVFCEEVLSAGVRGEEGREVVDESGDEDEWAGLGLGLDCLY